MQSSPPPGYDVGMERGQLVRVRPEEEEYEWDYHVVTRPGRKGVFIRHVKGGEVLLVVEAKSVVSWGRPVSYLKVVGGDGTMGWVRCEAVGVLG